MVHAARKLPEIPNNGVCEETNLLFFFSLLLLRFYILIGFFLHFFLLENNNHEYYAWWRLVLYFFTFLFATILEKCKNKCNRYEKIRRSVVNYALNYRLIGINLCINFNIENWNFTILSDEGIHQIFFFILIIRQKKWSRIRSNTNLISIKNKLIGSFFQRAANDKSIRGNWSMYASQ